MSVAASAGFWIKSFVSVEQSPEFEQIYVGRLCLLLPPFFLSGQSEGETGGKSRRNCSGLPAVCCCLPAHSGVFFVHGRPCSRTVPGDLFQLFCQDCLKLLWSFAYGSRHLWPFSGGICPHCKQFVGDCLWPAVFQGV